MKHRNLGFFGWRRTSARDVGRGQGRLRAAPGLGLGIGLMYFLDGNNGKRRRRLVADKLGVGRGAGPAPSLARPDAGHRLKGLVHEAGKRLHPPEPAVGGQLAGQIRSRMGHLVSHPHAIDVSVEDDRVVLEGPVLAKEADAAAVGGAQPAGRGSARRSLEPLRERRGRARAARRVTRERRSSRARRGLGGLLERRNVAAHQRVHERLAVCEGGVRDRPRFLAAATDAFLGDRLGRAREFRRRPRLSTITRSTSKLPPSRCFSASVSRSSLWRTW